MPSTDWSEVVSPGENDELERWARLLGDIQRKLSGDPPSRRALHAKQHAGLLARVEVLDGLPDELRQGLCAKPGVYDTYVRLSNGANRVQPDELPDIRGFAIKLLGVEGKKLIGGLEDAQTQDFLFIQSAASPFADVEQFVSFVRASSGSRALLLPRLVLSLGPFTTVSVLRRLAQRVGPRVRSYAEQRFFTAAPIQWGPYAAKLDLRPVDPPRSEVRAHGPSGYAHALAAHLREHALTYEIRVQLYVDAAETPIEDASVVWPEDAAPFRTVARLTIPAQDITSERGERVAKYVESLAFDPWHALVAHKPLGLVMRARNAAYRVSGSQRGALDERKVTLLPD
jgi:hypothetical protein